nr:MAG TPA: hypothetical protein [Caudoviricetes sp.]
MKMALKWRSFCLHNLSCFGKRKNVASFKYVISPHENGVKMAKFLFA